MKTTDVLQRFYKACQDKGLAPRTLESYKGYLRHLAEDYPELPTDTETIERYLRIRHEGPGHRSQVHRNLQAFYSWLEKADGIKSPVPPRGKMGRPPKRAGDEDADSVGVAQFNLSPSSKVVGGGINPSQYTSISTYQAVRAFINNRRVAGLKPTTITWYDEYLRDFTFMFPRLPVVSSQIDKFFDNPHWTNATRLGARRTLVAFYNFLVAQHTLPKDLVEITKIKHERKLRRILTRDDLKRLWLVANNPLERAILATLLDTKCRAGEMLSLTRERIFPDHALVDGKVGQRHVPLSRVTYDLLCQLEPSGPLFRNFGKPMSRSSLYAVVHSMMTRAGLSGEKLGPHILRHTSAVEHIMAGGDMMSLQQELGHASPEMTAHYAHLATDQLSQRHDKLHLVENLIDVGHSMGAGITDAATSAATASAEGEPSQPPPEPTPPVAEPRLVLGIRTRKL